MTNVDKFREIGIKIRKERDDYRANSVLWKLRERARTLKTPKAREKAWEKFKQAFIAAFPEGSTVWIDEGINFDTMEAGSFATYKPVQVTVVFNSSYSISFNLSSYDRVEIGYDPCGHDNLMGLELAQVRNASKQTA